MIYIYKVYSSKVKLYIICWKLFNIVFCDDNFGIYEVFLWMLLCEFNEL